MKNRLTTIEHWKKLLWLNVALLAVLTLGFVVCYTTSARRNYGCQQAQKYDFECLTQPNENPLEQCKEQQ